MEVYQCLPTHLTHAHTHVLAYPQMHTLNSHPHTSVCNAAKGDVLSPVNITQAVQITYDTGYAYVSPTAVCDLIVRIWILDVGYVWKLLRVMENIQLDMFR